jgi:hypothetical protein
MMVITIRAMFAAPIPILVMVSLNGNGRRLDTAQMQIYHTHRSGDRFHHNSIGQCDDERNLLGIVRPSESGDL